MRAFKNFKEEVIDKLLGFFITQRETHFFLKTLDRLCLLQWHINFEVKNNLVFTLKKRD